MPAACRFVVAVLFFAHLSASIRAGAPSREDVLAQTMQPYVGVSVPGVDVSTLAGKVMCGYQGWFNAEGDGAERGWVHWAKRRGAVADDNVCVDLWPDVSELGPDERFATALKLANGQSAEVFSSFKKPTVLRHFQWMREYGIDGAFVQRFAVNLRGAGSLRHVNTVLAHCREGANANGRAYAVMYDLSGLGANRIGDVMEDWRALRKRMKIAGDPAYLKHRGKPLVAVWGIGFNDNRQYTLDECRHLVEFLKNDPEAGGCSVMLGVPTGWRELNRDALKDPRLHDVIKLADVVSPWTIGRYRTPQEAARHAEKVVKPDLEWCAREKLDYLPVLFPGFSWFNLKGGELNQIPRKGGEFLWTQFVESKRAGASMLYVAMFDEVDEGTAIFKCTNAVPVGEKSKFLGYEGLPADFYLKLTGQGGKVLRGELPLTAPLPK